MSRHFYDAWVVAGIVGTSATAGMQLWRGQWVLAVLDFAMAGVLVTIMRHRAHKSK